MSEAEQNPQLSELVKRDMSPEQFDKAVEQVLSDEDKKILGEDALSKTRNGLLYLSAFAPTPATFDIEAYKAVAGFADDGAPLEDGEVDKLLEITQSVGVTKKEDDRFTINENLHGVLTSILEKYE